MPLNNGFQTFVNNELPVGVPGDFAGANPRASVVAPPGGYVAPAAGTVVGSFSWSDPTTGIASNYYKPSSFLGMVRRGMNALITQFLGAASATILPGNEVSPFLQGDFYAAFPSGGTAGQKVYANAVTGACTAAATGGAVSGTSTSGAVTTAGVLTIGGTIVGTLAVGQAVTGAGIPEGSYIASLGSGSGGAGTYNLANVNGTAFTTVTAEAVAFWGVQETIFYLMESVDAGASFTASLAAPVAPSVGGILTVSATSSGTINVGDFITATGGGGLTAAQGVQIVQQLTGSPVGGVGTYLTTATNQVVTSTNTFAASGGQVGKISSWP
jgi:hypothetical protein